MKNRPATIGRAAQGSDLIANVGQLFHERFSVAVDAFGYETRKDFGQFVAGRRLFGLILKQGQMAHCAFGGYHQIRLFQMPPALYKHGKFGPLDDFSNRRRDLPGKNAPYPRQVGIGRQ